ncbi:GNAT family N-acetyltransferase [Colwellia sp. KU-HH00111]|mgnify:CR=1 FL=1
MVLSSTINENEEIKMEIQLGDLDSSAVKSLLQQHHSDMLNHSPTESVHALDLSSLKADDVTFWTIWDGQSLAGCGALKKLNDNHAEIKSMRTSAKHLRQGVAAKLLAHILTVAQQQSYKKVSLETGTADAFIPAQKLYQKFGFIPCKPFAHYTLDPYSMFFTKHLKI